MSTYVVTGSASGMGAATCTLLREAGHRVIGVDRQEADVVADLATSAGRHSAVDAVLGQCDVLDGVATFAGVGGATGRPASLLASLNYFGTVQLIEAWRPLLAAAGESSAVAISSNSTTCQPGWSTALVDACLSGDEERARAVADEGDSTRADSVLGQLIGGFPLPLGRGGTAAELAQLVVFLLGPHARFFCGSVVLCDGGTEALLRPDGWPARWEV